MNYLIKNPSGKLCAFTPDSNAPGCKTICISTKQQIKQPAVSFRKHRKPANQLEQRA